MTQWIRPLSSSLAVAVAISFLSACGGGNSPSTVGTGGAGSASGGASGTASGGASGTASGGTSGTASGGSTGTKSGGASGSSGGSTGAGGGAFGEPACLSTVSKGAACTATDQQLCYKTCGPEKTGVKWEKCETSGTYSEMSGCTFDPARNFSCYKIPTAANTACPAGVTPQASMPCDVPHCTTCNSMQGLTGGQYLDSSGSMKAGWCTCQEASASGTRSWTCASDTAWPCPQGSGC